MILAELISMSALAANIVQKWEKVVSLHKGDDSQESGNNFCPFYYFVAILREKK